MKAIYMENRFFSEFREPEDSRLLEALVARGYEVEVKEVRQCSHCAGFGWELAGNGKLENTKL